MESERETACAETEETNVVRKKSEGGKHDCVVFITYHQCLA